MRRETVYCIKTSKAIGRAIEVNPNNIPSLIKKNGLPAWKLNGKGAWRALPEDLREWLKKQRDLALDEQRDGFILM